MFLLKHSRLSVVSVPSTDLSQKYWQEVRVRIIRKSGNQAVTIVMRWLTENRLAQTCFRGQTKNLAGNFSLWEKAEEEKMRTIAGYRSVIGRGMRAEKIRTYNFPQDRVTDHRIGKSWGNLDAVLDGELGKIVELTRNLQ